jgi:hypothetical protein
MVQILQMSKLVADQVVGDFHRENDEAPVEAERTVPGAAPPAGPLVSNRDPAVTELPLLVQPADAKGDDRLSLSPHPAFEEQVDVFRAPVSETDDDLRFCQRNGRPAPVIAEDANRPFGSQKKNTGAFSGRPFPFDSAGARESVKCPENPRRMPFQDGFRSGQYEMRRDNHFHESGFPDPE